MAARRDEPASYSLDDLHRFDTSGSYDEIETQPIKGTAASLLALSPVPQARSSGDLPSTLGDSPRRQPVRYVRAGSCQDSPRV